MKLIIQIKEKNYFPYENKIKMAAAGESLYSVKRERMGRWAKGKNNDVDAGD
ncbi:MAG TPA: hypothetical protein VKQ52_22525 [Puia sp.]|nr:hypothetical protein [Puia sp.]